MTRTRTYTKFKYRSTTDYALRSARGLKRKPVTLATRAWTDTEEKMTDEAERLRNAKIHMMKRMTDEAERLRNAKIHMMKRADLEMCPHFILALEHYREDGSCKCNDSSELVMADWGYEWNGVAWVSPKEVE